MLDGYSRTMLAGAVAPSEASWVALMVLYTACLRYGAPQTVISDSGGAYIADDFEAVCQRLQIHHERIVSTQGESYKNLMETHFNIQRRLFDYQFSLTTTPAEFEQVHQTFIQTYNTTAHQGLLNDQCDPPIPLKVLGQTKGRLYTPDELMRKFSQALFPRTTNPYGCVTLHSYHFYVEQGVPHTQVLLWVYGEQLRAMLDNVVLAEYHCRYDWRTRKVTEIRDGVFYPTRFASPQGTLIPLTSQESLILYRPMSPRRPAGERVPRQQLLLFELVRPASSESAYVRICVQDVLARFVLQTGELRVLEWSAHYPLAQILWGALFSRLFGFSFAALRCSTLVLAWAGLLAFYGTLRELGIRPFLAGLGTLMLWSNPVVFVLSHSFMTDVPFVSLMNAALFGYVRWVNRGRTWDLCLGSVLATLAFLVRQPGAALALVPVGYLLLAPVAGGERRTLPWSQRIWLLVPFLGIGLTLWWIKAVHGETRVYLEKAQMLRLIFAIERWVWVYVRELLHALLHLGLVLWPLAWVAFGRLSTRALAGASAVVAMLSGLVLWQEGALPNPLGIMLTWDELGLPRELIAGQIAHRQLPRWGQGVVLGVSLSAAVGLIAALWDGLRSWPHGVRRPGTVLLLNGLLQSLLFEALWLYYDRYYLPLLPGLTALLVACLRPTKGVIVVGMAGVLLWGTIAVTGTIDQFRYQQIVVEARDWLLRHGVAAEHIDAGYALNGWWLYAHVPTGPPSRGREPDVPWVTGWPILPYKIANVAKPSYIVVRSFRRPMLWAASDTLYVLEHTAVADHWGLPSMRAREQWSP